ncbi:tumor necrosis factor receptor superfamily member 6B-like [Denticeps clupeoides]|uniref:TNFR-Cys domain-containing protein n=1 Tax=Denticeps clupeoides TaxID=299321 RepID=A0AAY4ESC9_9TELE|nr:tumor necrosis factor receptor superfamily member 6B-like [Denticeps clupeoides]
MLTHVILVLLAAVPHCHQQTPPTYLRSDPLTGEQLTCDKCPPGTFVESHCTRDSATRCRACPAAHYTEFWNYVHECLFCDYPCGADQVETTPCTPLHNRACACKENFYRKHDFCLPHTLCPPGDGVVRHGTLEQDVRCAPCEAGFFSSESSSKKACERHATCAPHLTAVPGNRRQDTFCSACEPAGTSHGERPLPLVPPGESACEQEAARFLLQLALPGKQAQRLGDALRRHLTGPSPGASREELLRAMLADNSSQPFTARVLRAIQRSRLVHLEHKFRRWFVQTPSERAAEV